MSGTIAVIPELCSGIGTRHAGHALGLLGVCIFHLTLTAPANVLDPAAR